VWEVVQENGFKHLGESLGDIRAAMQFLPDEPANFHRFLDKFKILDHIIWNEDLIDRSIQATCDGLEKEGVDFAWMRFSINKYMDAMNWHKHEAIEFIYDSFNAHRPGKVGLILALKYESMRASQRQYASLIESPETAELLMGIDLVGDETYFDAQFYSSLFKQWSKAGKVLCAHVGESQSAENIRNAILQMGVKHVAHGIKIVQHMDILKLAKDRGICFDLAVTSNKVTGVWPNLSTHPIKDMLEYGLKVTIGTDDPVQCATTMDQEYAILKNEMKLSEESIQTIKNNAIDSTRAAWASTTNINF
jgi:adenosine deaminase